MKFYILDTQPDISESSAIVDAFPVDMENLGNAPQCPVCHEYIGGREDLPPYEVELELVGNEFGDIVRFSSDAVLVSEHFVQNWKQEALKGLSGFFPATIAKIKGAKNLMPPQYYLANIARSRAAIDDKKSVLIRENGIICHECRQGGGVKRVARIVVEEGSWSGEDIFIARGLPGTVITTRSFKDFCVTNRIKNAVLIDANEYSFDFYRGEN